MLGPVFIVSTDAGLYSLLAYHVDGHDLPLSRLAVVLAPGWALLQVVLPLPILLFPDGRIASRRWRWTLWAFVASRRGLAGHPCRPRIVAFTQHPVRIDSMGQSMHLDGTSHGVAAVIQDVVVGRVHRAGLVVGAPVAGGVPQFDR